MSILRLIFLVLCACLLPRPASSQPLHPLSTAARPLVVRLDSGTVLHRPVIGLDTAYYREVRLTLDATESWRQRDAQLLAACEHSRRLALAQLDLLRVNQALARTQATEAGHEYDVLRTDARTLERVPVQPPLLLDANTYKGLGLGLIGGVVLGILLHLHP